MLKHKRQNRFDDWFGPAMVVFIFAAAIVTVLVSRYGEVPDGVNRPGITGEPDWM